MTRGASTSCPAALAGASAASRPRTWRLAISIPGGAAGSPRAAPGTSAPLREDPRRLPATEARLELTVDASEPTIDHCRNRGRARSAQRTFPDGPYPPARIQETPSGAPIPLHVLVELALPELSASGWRRRVGATGMSMPEAAMHEAHRSKPAKHQVGSPGKLPVMQAVSETAGMESPTKGKLGSGIPAPDPRHHARTGCAVHHIGHHPSPPRSESLIQQQALWEVSITVGSSGSPDHVPARIASGPAPCRRACAGPRLLREVPSETRSRCGSHSPLHCRSRATGRDQPCGPRSR